MCQALQGSIPVSYTHLTVNLLVSDEVLAERRKSWVRPPLKQQKGVLNIYAQNCRPAEEGGAMQPWAPVSYTHLKKKDFGIYGGLA